MGLQLDDVYVWQACRMQIYYKLAEEFSLYKQPHSRQSGLRFTLNRLKLVFSSLTIRNPFLRSITADIAIFDHPRSRTFEDKVVDIYSYFLCEALVQEGQRLVVFERPFRYRLDKKHDMPRRSLGLIESTARFLSLIVPIGQTKDQEETLDRAALQIQDSLGSKLDLAKILRQQTRQFKLRRYFYGKLLDLYKIRQVYLVIGYSLAPLIDCCKKRAIPVSEIQHGVINKYHLGYSYPNSTPEQLHYFPDYLLAWGGKWPMTSNIPLGKDRIVEQGFSFFDITHQRYRRRAKQDRTLTIISQTVHGNTLARYLREHVSLLRDFKVFYKLHPSEFERFGQYEDLTLLSTEVGDFTIVEEGDIYEFLAISSTVVGVFSTALLEALQFDCDVYVCPLHGWEYMEELVASGTIQMLTDLSPTRVTGQPSL